MTLYYLFLFLIPFQDHPLFGHQLFTVSSIPITPVKVVGILLVLEVMLMPRPDDAAPRPSSGLLVLFLVFAIYPIIGTVLSFLPFPGLDASTFLSFAILIVATSSLVTTPSRLQNTIRASVSAETFASTWLYKQYYIYHWPRPLGPSSDPNYEALSLVLAVPLAVWLATYDENRNWRRVGQICAPTLAFAVFVAQSRGGLLALGVTAALGWLKSTHKLGLGVGFVAGILLLLAVGPAGMRDRLRHIRFEGQAETGAEISTRSRYELGRAGIHMMERHPMFGVGLDRFKPEAIHYNSRLLGVDPGQHIAHDTYIQLGGEGGIPTLMLYLGILLMTLFTCREVEKRPDVPEKFAALGAAMRIGLSGFMVAAVFLSAQFVKEPWVAISLAPPLYMIAAYVAAKEKKTAPAPSSQAAPMVLRPGYRVG
jgi:O-antigen ligase